MTKPAWFPAYIALGSNQTGSDQSGNNQNSPTQQLRTAIKKIAKLEKVVFVSESAFYRSEAYGPVEQDEFVNAVIGVITRQTPDELMQSLLDIEKSMGREREERWGPRVIDLDLLVYSQETSKTEFLKLPHPEIPKRNFVLLPLHDIAPNMMINTLGRVSTLLAKCDGGQIRKI